MKIKFIDREAFNYQKEKDKTYVAVIGTRRATKDFYNEVKEKVLNFLTEKGIDIKNIVLVSGGAKGVDKLAEKLADELGINILVIRPDYEKYYSKRAPLERNKTIASIADVVIAFPSVYGSSSGTMDAIKHAKRFGKTVKNFYLKI